MMTNITSSNLPALTEYAELIGPSQQKHPACIQIIWHWEDVQIRRPDLTLDQCCEVLSRLKRQHDATIGINWEVIDIVAQCTFPEPANLEELRDLNNQRYD